jgi:hypothetical protein
MKLLDKIKLNSTIYYGKQKFKVLGKSCYTTQKTPNLIYAKILLDNHFVLILVPSDSVAYLGQNLGEIKEFNTYPSKVVYNGKLFRCINSDYQIVLKLYFGSPIEVEGEVEFWDYESNESDIISVAVSSREGKRADVVAKYIDYYQIVVENNNKYEKQKK